MIEQTPPATPRMAAWARDQIARAASNAQFYVHPLDAEAVVALRAAGARVATNPLVSKGSALVVDPIAAGLMPTLYP